jgi:hypothetical protein
MTKKEEITSEMMDKAINTLWRNAAPPKVIETEDEAKTFTECDPIGRVWSVGDRYYLCKGVADTFVADISGALREPDND